MRRLEGWAAPPAAVSVRSCLHAGLRSYYRSNAFLLHVSLRMRPVAGSPATRHTFADCSEAAVERLTACFATGRQPHPGKAGAVMVTRIAALAPPGAPCGEHPAGDRGFTPSDVPAGVEVSQQNKAFGRLTHGTRLSPNGKIEKVPKARKSPAGRSGINRWISAADDRAGRPIEPRAGASDFPASRRAG